MEDLLGGDDDAAAAHAHVGRVIARVLPMDKAAVNSDFYRMLLIVTLQNPVNSDFTKLRQHTPTSAECEHECCPWKRLLLIVTFTKCC